MRRFLPVANSTYRISQASSSVPPIKKIQKNFLHARRSELLYELIKLITVQTALNAEQRFERSVIYVP
jgi:hypothetical protein